MNIFVDNFFLLATNVLFPLEFSLWKRNKPVMSFAHVIDTRTNRPFPSFPPTNARVGAECLLGHLDSNEAIQMYSIQNMEIAENSIAGLVLIQQLSIFLKLYVGYG